jgi:hypothetical protein
MGITRRRWRGWVSESDSKKWPFIAGKELPSDLGFGVVFVVRGAQNDADTKVTSLVDYLFFAPIGL